MGNETLQRQQQQAEKLLYIPAIGSAVGIAGERFQEQMIYDPAIHGVFQKFAYETCITAADKLQNHPVAHNAATELCNAYGRVALEMSKLRVLEAGVKLVIECEKENNRSARVAWDQSLAPEMLKAFIAFSVAAPIIR